MKVITKWTSLLLCLTSMVLLNGKLVAQDLNTALRFSESERYEDAFEVFKQVLKAQPNNGNAYFYYGENILKSYIADPYSNTMEEVVKNATDIFKKGIANDSVNPLNYIGMGMVILLEKGDTVKADPFFKRAELTIPKKAKKFQEKDIITLIKLGGAQLYAKEPRYQKAVTYLEKAKEGNDKNPNIYIALGEIYESWNNASLAVINYNKAVFLNNKLYVPLVKIGNLYMRSRNPEGARENFDKAKEIDSTYAPIYRGLGELYSLTGHDNFSVLNYRKFLELSGNNIPAKIQYVISLFRSKKYKDVIEYIEDIQKYDQSRNYLNRIAAYSAFEMKPPDYPKALNFIEAFFKNTTPEKTISKDYAYYGKILLKLKDTALVDKAFEKLVMAYKLDSTDADLIADIALNAYNNKKYSLSAEMLERKIALGNSSTNDQLFLGKSYYYAENYDKADAVFSKVIENDPNNVQALSWKANTYTAIDPDSKEGKAVNVYETIIQKASIDTAKYMRELYDAFSYLGSYYLYSKVDYGKSENYFKNIITLDPKNKTWQVKGYSSLGIIYTKLGRLKEARNFYNKALAIDPVNIPIQKVIESLTQRINIEEVNKQLDQ